MKVFLPICIITFFLIKGCKERSNDAPASSSTDNPLEIPALFERSGQLAKAAEWEKTKKKVAELKNKIAINSNDINSRLQIATIYLTEARITGEHPYYYPAIEKILNGVLSIDSKNFEATIFKASVKMSQHHFAEARELAEKARKINPDNAYAYGILVDANVELGNYEEAVTTSDKMQSLKPSLESYSRASYLREIHGDYKGAIEAMTLAVQAGLPGSEPQCWSKNALAQLYLNTDATENAEHQYNQILEMRPSYAFALAGLANIAKAKKQYDVALNLLDSAASIMPEFSFHEQMADIYGLKGENEKAQKKYAEVKAMLQTDAQSGHSVSLEFCKLFIKMNQLDSAKVYALEEYAIRPRNIDVNKELAWIAYKQNDFKKAKEYLEAAMRTGCKDPELLMRASSIKKA